MSIVFTLVELITFTIFIDYLEAVCSNAEQIHLDVLWPLPRSDLLSDFLKKKAGNTKTNTCQNYHTFESCS